MSSPVLASVTAPFLPNCSGFTPADFYSGLNTTGKQFDLANVSGESDKPPQAPKLREAAALTSGPAPPHLSGYLVHTVLPTMIPGLVLGALCLLGFFVFVIWLFVESCISCCRCCGRGRRGAPVKPGGDPAAAQQFLSTAAQEVREAAAVDRSPYAAPIPSHPYLPSICPLSADRRQLTRLCWARAVERAAPHQRLHRLLGALLPTGCRSRGRVCLELVRKRHPDAQRCEVKRASGQAGDGASPPLACAPPVRLPKAPDTDTHRPSPHPASPPPIAAISGTSSPRQRTKSTRQSPACRSCSPPPAP